MSRLELPHQGAADAPSSRSERRREPRPLSGGSQASRTGALNLPDRRPTPREPIPTFRLGNTLLAAGLLVVAAPLMAVVALAVRLTSRGPVIYRQPRVGLDRRGGGRSQLGDRRRSDLGGRPFSIYKFRTMYHRAGPHGRQVWTRPNDRRVTPVGTPSSAVPARRVAANGQRAEGGNERDRPAARTARDLRATAVNGSSAIPERQRVLPGITGLAQVRCGYGGSTADVERKLSFDLQYVEARSTWLDLRILVRTLPVVLARRGAR